MNVASLLMIALAQPVQAAGPLDTTTAEPVALPQVMTRSGREFVARCNDAAFANARFPQRLAGRCGTLLDTWRAEASDRGNRTPLYPGVVQFDVARGIPPIPDSSRGR